MRHLFVCAPICAVAVAALLLIMGVAWWIAIVAFFLTAPSMIGLAVLLCNTILPCEPERRRSSNSQGTWL